MFINFQQNLVSRSVKTKHINLFTKKVTSCIDLEFPTVIFKKLIISDMCGLHHRKEYKYINCQQNGASKSVKSEHTNLFAKNRRMTIVILQKLIISSHAFQTCSTP